MGSYTKEAIKAFQRKVGLIPDGVAGNRTKSAMRTYTGCLFTIDLKSAEIFFWLPY